MLDTLVYSKFIDLSKSFKGFYIIGLGTFLSILAFLVYTNIIVTITLISCTLVSFIVLTRPQRQIQLQINPNNIILGNDTIPLQSVISWAIVDLGDTLEFVIQTTDLIQDFHYFYIDENEPVVVKIIEAFSNYFPYQEEITKLNKSHNFLRNWGLK
jgi:hypothetical protein